MKIDYYIPHSKETFHISGVTYLRTELIFEDLVVLLLKEYEFVKVYHFTSSVSLHLRDNPNVIISGISIPYYENRQDELRRLGCQFETGSIGW